MNSKNLHKDHRQRARSRYRSEGLGSMADHNILELLLFYGIPYKDTNPIAHELIEHFGSLQGVIDAPVEELQKINGVGENAAIALAKAREGCDEFVSIDDFAQKASASSSTIEALRQVGAFGSLPETRQMSLFDM